MRTKKQILFGFCNLGVLALVVWIFFLYALPWVEGSGSVLKPVDDVTKIFQNIDPTGILKFSVEAPKKVVDTMFSVLTFGRTEQQLTGYEIPLSDNASIREKRPAIFLLYSPIVFALVCAALTFRGDRRMRYDVLCLLLALAVFVVKRAIGAAMQKESLFVTIGTTDGFALVILAFFGIAVVSALKIVIHKVR